MFSELGGTNFLDFLLEVADHELDRVFLVLDDFPLREATSFSLICELILSEDRLLPGDFEYICLESFLIFELEFGRLLLSGSF